MLGSTPVMAFVASRSLHAARAFYGDLLGLRLTSEDDFGLMFDAGGTVLRIARVEQLAPASYTVLGWVVTDIAAAVADLVARGVRMERFGFMEQDEQGVWRAPGGAQIAWFKD